MAERYTFDLIKRCLSSGMLLSLVSYQDSEYIQTVWILFPITSQLSVYDTLGNQARVLVKSFKRQRLQAGGGLGITTIEVSKNLESLLRYSGKLLRYYY